MNSPLQDMGTTKPPNITHYPELDSDVVTWSNKDLPIDAVAFILVPSALFFLPVFCTWSLKQDLVASLPGLIPVWLFPIFLATFIFRQHFWQETVVISDESITLSRTGFFAPKDKLFRKEDVIRISYESYNDVGSPRTLNIVYRRKFLNSRIRSKEVEQLAFLTRKKEVYQLFLYLQKILHKRGWPTLDEA